MLHSNRVDRRVTATSLFMLPSKIFLSWVTQFRVELPRHGNRRRTWHFASAPGSFIYEFAVFMLQPRTCRIANSPEAWQMAKRRRLTHFYLQGCKRMHLGSNIITSAEIASSTRTEHQRTLAARAFSLIYRWANLRLSSAKLYQAVWDREAWEQGWDLRIFIWKCYCLGTACALHEWMYRRRPALGEVPGGGPAGTLGYCRE